MHYLRYQKEAFCVIGKEGSTADGPGFVQRLWADANAHFTEVSHLAKKNEVGGLTGIWGVMTDFSRSFAPWQNHFSEGLYLAGVEVEEATEAPEGWTKWAVPAFDYLVVTVQGDNTFDKMIAYMQANELELAGAVQDFLCPDSGENRMLFPIKRL